MGEDFVDDLNEQTAPVRKKMIIPDEDPIGGFISDLLDFEGFGSKGGGGWVANAEQAKLNYEAALKTNPLAKKPEIVKSVERVTQVSNERAVVGTKVVEIPSAPGEGSAYLLTAKISGAEKKFIVIPWTEVSSGQKLADFVAVPATTKVTDAGLWKSGTVQDLRKKMKGSANQLDDVGTQAELMARLTNSYGHAIGQWGDKLTDWGTVVKFERIPKDTTTVIIRKAETEGGPTMYQADRDNPMYWDMVRAAEAGNANAPKTATATILKYGAKPTEADSPAVQAAYMESVIKNPTAEPYPGIDPNTQFEYKTGDDAWWADKNNQLLVGVGVTGAVVVTILAVVFVPRVLKARS